MDKREIFQVLGIEETKDEGIIKKAYREKLSVTNPEDKLEEFKRLRTAYEEAVRLAKEPEEEQHLEEEDTTPSGLWLRKVEQVYSRLNTRTNIACWKELFAEEIFLSLEEEENCRIKLLRFLMENYRLPTVIWRLLDEKVNISKDSSTLKEQFPAEFINYIVVKCDRGEDIDFSCFEGAEDADYDLFISYYDRCWRALQAGELSQAEEFIKNADDLHIFHPVIEICRAELLEKQEKLQEAIDVLKELWEKYPEDVMVGYNYAEMLWRSDRKEMAASVFEQLKQNDEKHYMANVHLADWYYTLGRYEDAKKCAKEIMAVGASDSFMELVAKINHELEKDMEKSFRENRDVETGLELCSCYLQDGRYEKGAIFASDMERIIPEDKKANYYGLLAKFYVEGADYEKCLEMAERWEKALFEKMKAEESEEEREKDAERIRQTHIIRMQCYRNMGYVDAKYFEDAIRECELIEKDSERDFHLKLEMANIYKEMGEYEKGLEILQRLIDEHQIHAAHANAQEIYRRMWNAQGVVDEGRQCIYYFPDYVKAYEHIARVYLDLKYTEDLKALLEEASQNQIESPMLEAYRYQMERTEEIPSEDVLNEKIDELREKYVGKIEEGKMKYYQKGLPLVTEYFYWYPGSYMLVERGNFHQAAGELELAKKDYEKALSENPSNPYAWNALHHIHKEQGDFEQAMVCLRKAILFFGEEAQPGLYADMGNLYSLMGYYGKALKSYMLFSDKVGSRAKRMPYYMSKMADCMARMGQIEDALELIEGAYADNLEMYSRLVVLCLQTNEAKKAKNYLERWRKELTASSKYVNNQKYQNYYNNQGWCELLFGTGSKAMEFFEKTIQSKGPDISICESYCDMIFACILCGDDNKGKLYSAKLRDWREREKKEGLCEYLRRPKERLHLEILAEYYVKSLEELEAMLDEEENCGICRSCTNCVCMEMEGVRILLMLRKGETEAALTRVKANLEKHPLDEYMRAILHICEDGVKVVPYSVNAPKAYRETGDTLAEKSSQEEADASQGKAPAHGENELHVNEERVSEQTVRENVGQADEKDKYRKKSWWAKYQAFLEKHKKHKK